MILDHHRCRPFDATRAGLNLGEGAAYIVLESEEMASKRGVKPHVYLTGYGNACDAFHQTASSEDGEGAYLAMKEALVMAHVSPKRYNTLMRMVLGHPITIRVRAFLCSAFSVLICH